MHSWLSAILYFAVNIEVQAVDISLMGLILMIAGAIWLVINLIADATTRRRRRAIPVEGRDEIIEE